MTLEDIAQTLLVAMNDNYYVLKTNIGSRLCFIMDDSYISINIY